MITAQNGLEAINYGFSLASLEGRTLPDVIVLDLKLPNVDGFEVLSRLRAHPHMQLVPVIVLSSSAEPTGLEFAACQESIEMISIH
jgi:CheY-like chemotaxis protein